MKKSDKKNYLDNIPFRREDISWESDEKGSVTLSIENKGLFNKIAQKFFKKPRFSYVHLDEFGSFVWQLIDGEKDITEIGVFVKEHFAEKAEPLYPRLAKFFQILSSYGFVKMK